MPRPPSLDAGRGHTAVERAYELLLRNDRLTMEDALALAHLSLVLELSTKLAPSLGKWPELVNAREYLRERGVS